MIFAMDPGVSATNATGVALFHPQLKRLVAAAVIRPPVAARSRLDLYRHIAEDAVVWALQNSPHVNGVSVFVTEWPQIYPHERKKDPNTALLPLAGLIGHVSGMLSDFVTRAAYTPHEWKGSVKGDEFLERILERLDPRERQIVEGVNPAGLRHNAIDAAGLGLKFLGRMERFRAVHNETRAGRVA